MAAHKSRKRWVAKVTTDSTHPAKGLFTKDATTIAHALASKRVSPEGAGVGLEDVELFHQSRRQGTFACAAASARTREVDDDDATARQQSEPDEALVAGQPRGLNSSVQTMVHQSATDLH